jgi:uncharacterized phiE125 gp8 family phage protein
MRRYIVTVPTVEPMTLIEAKRWLRVDHNDDDGLIAALIKAARQRIESRTGRAIMAQTWRIALDQWPAEARVALPMMPVMSVTAVRVIDAAGVPAVLASTLYALESGSEPPVLAVKSPPNPGRLRGGIEIDVVAGYGVTAAECPEPLRQAMRLLLLAAYEGRGPERAGERRPDIVTEVDRLIAPYRQLRIGRSLLESAA